MAELTLAMMAIGCTLVEFNDAVSRFEAPGAGHLISMVLKFFSSAAITLLLTPYSVNTYFDLLHKTIRTTLFVGQLGLSLHWILERSKDRIG